MTFANLKERFAAKKKGCVHVVGGKDKAALDFWTKCGGQIRYHEGESQTAMETALQAASRSEGDFILCLGACDVEIVPCIRRALGESAANNLTILKALEVSAYPKLLWIGYSPLADYSSLPAAAASLQTMLAALAKLGEAAPRVALLSCVELVTPGVKSTLWQAPLAQMSARGQFGAACVDGPLGLDLAVSPEAVAEKKVKTEIAGEADLLVPPNFGSFISLSDAIILTGEHRAAGVILGAPVPIAFPPRLTPDHIERSLDVASLLA